MKKMSELLRFLLVFIFSFQVLVVRNVASKKMVKNVVKNPINIVISDVHSDRWKIGFYSLMHIYSQSLN